MYVIHTKKAPDVIVREILDILEESVHPNRDDHLWANFRVNLFKPIHHAFDVKSRGGADRFGNRWQPLSASRRANKKINKNRILVESGRLQSAVTTLAQYYPIDFGAALGAYRQRTGQGGGTSYTSEEQAKVTVDSDSLICEVTNPYAVFQDTDQLFYYKGVLVFKPGRPLWPDKLGIWFGAAVGKLAKSIVNKIINNFQPSREELYELSFGPPSD